MQLFIFVFFVRNIIQILVELSTFQLFRSVISTKPLLNANNYFTTQWLFQMQIHCCSVCANFSGFVLSISNIDMRCVHVIIIVYLFDLCDILLRNLCLVKSFHCPEDGFIKIETSTAEKLFLFLLLTYFSTIFI